MGKFMMVQVQTVPYPGTAYLNSAVTGKGHSFHLCLATKIRPLLEQIAATKPDLIGFSCMTPLYKIIREYSEEIKREFNIPIILGGPHPTFFPNVIEDAPFDMVCRGEGELALPELLDAISSGRDCTAIKNIWVKRNGIVLRNDLRPLVNPLDNVPVIDWGCYQGTGVKNYAPVVHPIRGCPYSCSYCFNKAARDLYQSKGSEYIRYFSVERSIIEVQAALRFFSNSPVVFTSDSFGMDLEWMRLFFDAYSAATDRPFFVILRPELITDACVEILARHRCCGVAFGVESGSERVRREVLNRHYSNDQLLKVAQRLHNNGIKFRTYNMVGLPTETESELWETIDLNVRLKTDFPRATILIPLPQTRIFEIAKERGFLDSGFSFDQVPCSPYDTTPLKNVDVNLIENALYFFITAIKFPRLKWFIRRLMHTKSNFLYRWWFYIVYAYSQGKSEQRNLISYIMYLFANRHTR